MIFTERQGKVRYLVVGIENTKMLDFIGVFADLELAKLCAENTPAYCEILEVKVRAFSGN